MKDTGEGKSTTYIDTPNGIITENGTWFRTTEDSLREFAGELVDHEPVQRLLSSADLWLAFPANLSLWLIPIALWQLNPFIATGSILLLYILLKISGPFYTSHSLSFIPSLINRLELQAILYFFFLTILLQSGLYSTAIFGFILFVLFRWGVVKKILDPILKAINGKIYKVSYEDKVLRSVIVKKSMKYRTTLKEVTDIESSIVRKIVGRQ